MKILILGASGTIGSAIYKCLSNQYHVYGTYHKNQPDNADNGYFYKYDIADCEALEHLLGAVKPDWIISSLTGNFEHQLAAHKRVADYLKESSGRCIFLSTANVFDGSPNAAHSELDEPYPISEYGKYKYSCEQMLRDLLGHRNLVVRLPRTLSPEGAMNEVKGLEKGQPVFSNLYMSYNAADHVANAIKFCIEQEKHGVIHLTSDDYISTDLFMNILLLKYKKNLQYTADLLTLENYCDILDCHDPDLVRCSDDGNFYLALKSTSTDLFADYSILCQNVVELL